MAIDLTKPLPEGVYGSWYGNAISWDGVEAFDLDQGEVVVEVVAALLSRNKALLLLELCDVGLCYVTLGRSNLLRIGEYLL